MKKNKLTEPTILAFFLKPVWQDFWRGRVRIVLMFSTSLTLLLWINPSARSYDHLYIALIVVSTILPLSYFIQALFQYESHRSDDELNEAGMLRIEHLDDRNIIPLAVLTTTILAASVVLLQVPPLRATLQNPLPLAPSRWMAAVPTALVVSMLCHMGFISFDPRL